MRIPSALPALACLLLAGPASAAEPLDCANATSTVEMNYCGEQDYNAADAELNAAYKQALAKIAKSDNPKPYDPRSWETALRASQRAWVAFRDAECKGVVPMEWSGGTGATGGVLACMTELTRQRTAMLNERYADEPVGPARVP
jgi:uncharacterized protein YecT (DUF1311 family)